MKHVTGLLIVLLSGCATLNTSNLSIRSDVLDVEPESRVFLRSITSQGSKMKAEDFKQALIYSLAGQGFTVVGSESTPKILVLEADYVSSSAPSWGAKTKVNSRFDYRIYSGDAETPNIERQLKTSCTSAINFTDTIAGDFAVVTLNGVIIDEEERTSDSLDQAEDAKLGFPRQGVPISSITASKRGDFATECSIRKGIVEILNDLNASHKKI